jgi:uncharacterized protein YdhG (YjbR/CyaY superfamily)
MARPGFQSVDEYIAAQPAPARPALERVRATIRKALPGATEGISYQIPVYKLGGVMVVYFAGFQRHYSIYPASERLVAALGDELAGALHSKATIRFQLEDSVPTRLIARIAKLRAAEASERAAARGTKRAATGKRPATRKAKPAARRKVAKRG